MDTRHLVDPELRPALDLVPMFEFSAETLHATRAFLDTPLPTAPAPAFEPERAVAKGRHGAPDVPLSIFDPPGRTSRACLLHIHGGGMIMGSAAMNILANAALAAALGVLIVSVDYRLAPETPFPGPQDDCMAALDWIVASAQARGVDPSGIAVMGESAGGGLAASVALMARGEGRIALCGQFLTYPMLDHRTGTRERPGFAHTGEFVWTRAHNQYGWEALRGDYGCDDERAGWFSPSLAKDLAGLPPTYIATASLDLFLEENLDYANRLAGAGVPLELHVYPGAFHGFNMAATARVTRAYQRDLAAAIGALLASYNA